MTNTSSEVTKYPNGYLQGALVCILEDGPRVLSDLRVVFQNTEYFDVLDPVSSERKFLAALEQLKKDGDITVDGAIPCDQSMIRLNVHKS